MTAKKHNHNLKHLMLMLTAKNHPELIEGFVRSLSDKYDSSRCDWDDYVGLNVYKGEAFERYLKSEGHWDYTFNTGLNALVSPSVEKEVREKHPDIDKIAKQNPTMEMEYRARIAAELITSPTIRSAFKQKEMGRGAVAKPIVAALGASKLAMGAWVQIYKGISKSLSSPKGGSVSKIFKAGGIHEMAILLQAPTMKIAKEKGFVVARQVKDKIKTIAASVAAIAALTLSFADTAPQDYDLIVKQHTDGLSRAGVQQTINEVSAEKPTLVATNGALPSVAEMEVQHKELMSVSGGAVAYNNSMEDANFQEFSSLEAWLQDNTVNQKSVHKVAEGENLWLIAEKVSIDLTNKILDGFDYVLNEDCKPTEREKVVAAIHKQIIDSNGFDNPDLIHAGQEVTIPSSVLSTVTSDLNSRIDFAANCLSPSEKITSVNKIKF
ncbi:LysM peptidoglycan-binding domain-containing protein [Vibrio crassostreae]|uniref:LysM peptidoglycan-binding domain-containing protein n=1 Tax=Vibrio crassostreae TaxID=246167 RepID=UPI001B310872|nr:LysM peptidoglycan-binding domain-containing protein [Vibrio crassostreae]